MAMRIQLRRGTSAEWTSANPVLAEGESGLETDTGNVKYGDGVRPWAELPYSVAVPGPGEVIVGSAGGPVAVPVDSIGGGGAAPVELPTIADLYLHLDAQSLAASDGDRIGSVTASGSGSVSFTQATNAKQPQYQIAALNGRPALAFDATRYDKLTGAVSPPSTAATIFTVIRKAPNPTGNKYIYETSGTSRNLFSFGGTSDIGIQGVGAFYRANALDDVPQIVTAQYNGTDSLLRIDGAETTGNTGEDSASPTLTMTVGGRITEGANTGFSGLIGEILWYSRILTPGEIAAVETYLASRWGLSAQPQRVWHVDSAYGSDSNTGRTAASPVASLSRVRQGVIAAKATDADVLITAPQNKPMRVTTPVTFDMGGTVRLRAAIPGRRWHLAGSQRFTGGWTHDGGGVYSRALTMDASALPLAFLPTLLDGTGQPTRVYVKNTATPTTPAAGEVGYSSGRYYLHIPGDVDPNLHVVEVALALQVLVASNNTTLVIEDGVLYGGKSAVVLAGSATLPGGRVEAYDSDADYSGAAGSWATIGANTGMYLERCRGRYSYNDGFNHHGDAGNMAVMELIDCEGAYCDDEGVSPHDDTRLILRGGRYHHNGNGGLTAVGNSDVQIFATEFDHNGLLNPVEAGVNFDQNVTASSTDLYTHDNTGPGIRVAATATWLDHGGTRSENNGAPDMLP